MKSLLATTLLLVACSSTGSTSDGGTSDARFDGARITVMGDLVITGPSNGTVAMCTVTANTNGFSVKCPTGGQLTSGLMGTPTASIQNIAANVLWPMGPPQKTTYTSANVKNANAVLMTNLGGNWQMDTAGMGTFSLTITDMEQFADTQWAVHGSFDATLPYAMNSTVKAEEKFHITF